MKYHNYEIEINNSSETEKVRIELIVNNALKHINNICDKYGWLKYTEEPFFNKVIISHQKSEFDLLIKKIAGISEDIKFPDTYTAFLISKNLGAMSSSYYSQIYPDGVEENSYMKLFAHEIAHELHIRLLEGEEEKMGPVWFYEGFATYISDQFVNNDSNLSSNDMKTIVLESKRGSYKKYNYLLKYLIKHTDIHDMINKAAENTINDWAISILQKNQ